MPLFIRTWSKGTGSSLLKLLGNIGLFLFLGAGLNVAVVGWFGLWIGAAIYLSTKLWSA